MDTYKVSPDQFATAIGANAETAADIATRYEAAPSTPAVNSSPFRDGSQNSLPIILVGQGIIFAVASTCEIQGECVPITTVMFNSVGKVQLISALSMYSVKLF
jgi:hypothetical protein